MIAVVTIPWMGGQIKDSGGEFKYDIVDTL
jgi:hypothetical protein